MRPRRGIRSIGDDAYGRVGDNPPLFHFRHIGEAIEMQHFTVAALYRTRLAHAHTSGPVPRSAEFQPLASVLYVPGGVLQKRGIFTSTTSAPPACCGLRRSDDSRTRALF